jgi:hypothetical protein
VINSKRLIPTGRWVRSQNRPGKIGKILMQRLRRSGRKRPLRIKKDTKGRKTMTKLLLPQKLVEKQNLPLQRK